MRMILKFGGTSVADVQRLRRAASRCGELAKLGHEVVAVVSAQGHTTDEMIEKARQVSTCANVREMDAYLSAGEQMSACLMAMTLENMGLPAVSLSGWQAGLETDGAHGNARVKGLCKDRIQRELEKGKIVVVAGFQGIDEEGDITTLGRGGSDTTAVALAAYLHADVCQIYTDVDGVYDKDPRVFPDAVRYDRIGYEKMLMLARQGAQVLHDRCVELAWERGVRVQVLSSFREGEGTWVMDTP